MLIEKTIDEFLSKSSYYYGYKKTTVKNLMKGKYDYSLLNIYNSDELEANTLIRSIKDSVKSYTSSKDNAIDIYKKYLSFLNTKYDFYVEITFPPIPVSITFERIMFIAKYIQNPEHKISDLEDILWVGNRTIENDLALLRGNTDDPIQISGKRFVVEDMERNRGRITMSSTVHPIFLTSNLTQVLVTLKGLKFMSQDSAYNTYAEEMAKSIWSQLSDYARDRILYVTEKLIPDELDWYKSLGEKSKEEEDSYHSEIRCSNTEGPGCVLDCLKNGKACFIEYKNNDKTTFYENSKITQYLGDKVRINYKDQIIDLELENIVRSSYTPEELM
jgi:hypothetical protein